jgi:NhaP-type Na+/H+ and K+/H+ antiporter
MNKISVIKRSVACQWLGVCSLVPLIGLAFAAEILRRYRWIRDEVGTDWNPARKQLMRGVILAWIGTAITALLFAVFAALAVRAWLVNWLAS